MNKKLTILAIVAMTAALISLGGGLAQAGNSDWSLFTTSTDDFVTCTAKSAATLHVMATNVGASDTTIQVIFPDGDSIPFEVPNGESFSFTQVVGNGNFDDVIKIDPQDNDGDVNVMVMWVSIRGGGVSCSFEPLP